MYRDLFFRLRRLLTEAVEAKIFPGASIGIVSAGCGNQQNYFYSYGHGDYTKTSIINHHTVYDLASLTKPLATTLAILSLIKINKISLDDTISSLLHVTSDSEIKHITVYNLLNHNSGLPAYHEFYKELSRYEPAQRKMILQKLILSSPLTQPVGVKQVYSDLGFMLLGMLVEQRSGSPLHEYVQTMLYQPLGLEKNLFFIPHGLTDSRGYAPTEWCPWRKKLLQGEVHDENAAALGGVAGHAGLFGTITGVLDLIAFLLEAVNGRREHPHIDNRDLRRAVSRQNEQGSWGLGFDTPSKGTSSSGSYFSERSFGHLGFTGTSFWIDPEQELAIVLLSNRVHPDRGNNQIREFRPLLHDAVMELLSKERGQRAGRD